MSLLRVERLLINMITLEAAPFLLSLMNVKDWVHNIGDRGIKLLYVTTCLFHTPIIHTVSKLTMVPFGWSFQR